MDKLKPIPALSKCFRTGTLLEFQQELKDLKESCPPQTQGRQTSYVDFCNEVGKFLGVEIDWAGA